MVLATTNCPWDLDEAMRRRLEKRIHIPLPVLEARKEHFKICLRDLPVSQDVDTAILSGLTEGYSGADIHIACREASMMPMRRLIAMMDPMEIHELRSRGQLTVPKVSCYSDYGACRRYCMKCR
jgi:katanin p60 ATPase-containing subunit A1